VHQDQEDQDQDQDQDQEKGKEDRMVGVEVDPWFWAVRGPEGQRYRQSFYFMKKQMLQLHEQPYLKTPFWPREFVEGFAGMEGGRRRDANEEWPS
jgi:hypothetical protein